jgi:hypothetical protein
MYKIIGGDGQEYGPVTSEQLKQWLTEGRVNAQTLVQSQETGEWSSLGDLPEFAGVPGAAPAAVPAAPVDPAAVRQQLEETLRARPAQFDIGGCISAGWELVKAHFGLLAGATFVIFMINGAASSVPFIGGIASMIIGGPLMGGLYWLYIRQIRGEPDVSFNDAFAGFSRGFVQLMLTQIVVTFLVMLPIIPGGVLLGVGAALHENGVEAAPILIAAGGILALAGICVCVYLSIAWIFALPLVADKQIDFWPAMQLSRRGVGPVWWRVFGLMLVAGLIGMLGVLLCCIGIFLTIPITIAAAMYAYEDIFGGSPAS